MLVPENLDPVLDPATVLGLVRNSLPGVHVVTGVDESGGEARTYAVDDDVIVKVQRPQKIRPRTSLEKEAFILRHLETSFQDGPLPVPRVFGHGRESTPFGQVEYICMSRVEGACAQNTDLKGQERVALLGELGSLMRRIHSAPQSPLIQSGLIPGDRIGDDFAKRLEAKFADAMETLQNSAMPWPGRYSLESIQSKTVRALPQNDPRPLVVLHSNPGPTHTFVVPALGKFSGLIDFGDAYVSHPAFDLIRWPTPGDREAVLQGYLGGAGAGILGDSFTATWRIVSVLAELQSAAWDSAYVAQAATHIDDQMEMIMGGLGG
jgi:hygromycin-B 7''-O-kinase